MIELAKLARLFALLPFLTSLSAQSADDLSEWWISTLKKGCQTQLSPQDSTPPLSPNALLAFFENSFSSPSYDREDLIVENTRQAMLMAEEERVDPSDVTSVLAKHWTRIFQASALAEEPSLDTARLVAKFFIRHGSALDVGELGRNLDEMERTKKSFSHKAQFYAYSENTILHLGFKHKLYEHVGKLHLIDKYLAQSVSAFQKQRTRPLPEDKKTKVVSYTNARSQNGRVLAFLQLQLAKKAQNFGPEVFSMDPIAKDIEAQLSQVRSYLKYVYPDTDRSMAFQTKEKLPVRVYADLLQQMGSKEQLDLSSAEKGTLELFFSNPEAEKVWSHSVFSRLEHDYKEFFSVAAALERFLVSLKKHEGGQYTPLHDDILPLLVGIDPNVVRFLQKVSLKPEVLEYSTKLLRLIDSNNGTEK